jgi:hypothetical protein
MAVRASKLSLIGIISAFAIKFGRGNWCASRSSVFWHHDDKKSLSSFYASFSEIKQASTHLSYCPSIILILFDAIHSLDSRIYDKRQISMNRKQAQEINNWNNMITNLMQCLGSCSNSQHQQYHKHSQWRTPFR